MKLKQTIDENKKFKKQLRLSEGSQHQKTSNIYWEPDYMLHRTMVCHQNTTLNNIPRIPIITDKSSAVADMGDRGHNRHGPKRGGLGAAVHFSRGAGTPSNTMWLEPRSTSVPNGVFINPAVWPQ